MSVRKFSQILPILLDKERGEIDGLTIFQILKLTYHVTWHIVSVWIQRLLHFAFFVFFFFFFFFFCCSTHFRGQISLFMLLFINSSHIYLTFYLLFITLVDPVYCLRNSQTSLFSNFFIKNRSHNAIHTFKNYFTIVFSIFSKNKLYPNGPILWSSSIEILDNKAKVFKLGLTVRLGKPQIAQNYDPFNIKNRSMQKKQGPIQTTVRPPDSVNHERFWRFKPELFLFLKKIKTLQTHSTKSPLLKLQP